MSAPIQTPVSLNANLPNGNIDPAILSQFSEIALPQEVGFWPFSWQLWLLIITAFIFLTCLSLLFFRRVQKNLYRKTALKQLKAIYSNDENFEVNLRFQKGNEILKTCLIRANHPIKDFYSKFGVQWYNYLYSDLPEGKKKQVKINKEIKFLDWEKASYGKNQPKLNEVSEFMSFCEIWIKHHKIRRRNHV